MPKIARRRALSAGAHESREEALADFVGRLKLFGVVLHGEGEEIRWELHCFGDIVWGPCDDAHAVSCAVDGLMVEAVDAVARGVEDGGQS